MAASTAITTIDLPGLEKIAHGKVRDLFRLDDNTLLFVASDRISAFDVVLANGIPHKGAILTLTSARWFALLTERLPTLRTHFIALDAPAPSSSLRITEEERALLRHRSMQVRRFRIFPLEAIVRGYLAGSGWAEYQRNGTVHGIPLPPGLQLGSRLPKALYTPSTKAEAGQHDENIHPDEAARLVGAAHAARIADLAVALYETAAAYALERGIIIADTKFEFGLDEATDEVVLVDEVLTPDSSRFWPAEGHEPGREPESFDKQPLRDWLVREGLKGKEGVVMPDEVWQAAAARYKDVYERLWGKKFDDELTS